MKVILKEDVKGLGKKENMVEVSDGYARNFLIPKGLAVEANSANIHVMKTRQEAEKTKKERELANARALAEKIKGMVLVIKTKAGENGKLFGSITNKYISDRLKKDFNLDIDKKKINMSDAIKSLGTTEVEIKLYTDVSAKLTVKVEQE
ncbi:MAG: 50S ribosomal protein L9 [Clostridiales bacterium]|nr:50S ribosomal protein L9 [Eubacteriales bacterium]MDH7566253.1 50S ribosomal protein L9 [Clostridiales bacterium]